MTKVVDPLRPDVVHAVDASAAAAWPGCLFSVPPELPSVAGRSAQIRLFRRAMTTAGTVLVPSPEVARELADHWDLQADVLPMGSDAWSAAAHRRVYRRIMRGAAAA
jgi:hypothetical protein